MGISKEVRDRANSLSRLVGERSHKYQRILMRIVSQGLMMDISGDLLSLGATFDKHDALRWAEWDNQRELERHGIRDDETAMTFLDRIEYEILDWDEQWRKLLNRQEDEREEWVKAIS